jgi:hypothetical protein
LVFPVAVGRGRRLFHDDGDSIELALLSSDSLDNGVMHVVYGPFA